MKDRMRIWSETFLVGDSNEKNQIDAQKRPKERQNENLEWNFSCWRQQQKRQLDAQNRKKERQNENLEWN